MHVFFTDAKKLVTERVDMYCHMHIQIYIVTTNKENDHITSYPLFLPSPRL